MAWDIQRTSDRRCNSLPLVSPSPFLPPSAARRTQTNICSTKRHIHLSCAAAFNHDRNCNWNKGKLRARALPQSKKIKRKKELWESEATESFFLCDQFSLSCISLQKFPLPGERHTVHWHTNRKQILVVQRAGTLFDLLRILSCKILNIYVLQLKYPCSSSDSQEKRPRDFQFPIRLIT